MKKVLFLIMALILVLGIIGCSSPTEISEEMYNEIKYQEALSFLNAEKYLSAYKSFSEISDYKDSAEILEKFEFKFPVSIKSGDGSINATYEYSEFGEDFTITVKSNSETAVYHLNEDLIPLYCEINNGSNVEKVSFYTVYGPDEEVHSIIKEFPDLSFIYHTRNNKLTARDLYRATSNDYYMEYEYNLNDQGLIIEEMLMGSKFCYEYNDTNSDKEYIIELPFQSLYF